ncbi:MAG: DUF4394 domain-containing protein [Planctomycetia bacterium]|nr:DUF4394 domain-containing protein [Planctomycetia bacterium]
MITKFTFYRFGILFTALFGLLAAVPAAQATNNRKAIGLTQDGVLVRFSTGSPGNTQDIGFITGLQGNETLIGIDFRVQDGLLYGVGNAGGLYTINTANAVASFQNYTLNPGPQGSFFGVDFNPAANALRVVSDTGQNLRVPFVGNVPQATVDDSNPPSGPRPLTYAALVPPVTATGISAAAYTNNDLVATTGTTLFDIDTATLPPATDPQDVVVIQSPANAGSVVTTGSLGVDAGPQAGFDIFSQLRAGVAVSNTGFASLFVNGRYRLYTINLLTGNAKLVGAFDDDVFDLAIRLNQ